MMIELVQNDEWISKDITVEDGDSFIFGLVATRDVVLASFGQAYFELWDIHLVFVG